MCINNLTNFGSMNEIKINSKESNQMTPILQTTKMSLTFHTKSPIQLLQFNPQTHFLKLNSNPFKISCSSKEKEIMTDEILSLELSYEINKINTQTVKRQEALKKSRQLLFFEVSNFMGLKSEDCKKKWNRMNEDEKWVLVKGFVAEWSCHFHPLSVKSVKEMVEEYLTEFEEDGGSLFPDLIKFLGFSSDRGG